MVGFNASAKHSSKMVEDILFFEAVGEIRVDFSSK